MSYCINTVSIGSDPIAHVCRLWTAAAFAAVSLCAGGGTGGESLVLAARGRPSAYTIVIADKATPSQRYAAEELRDYAAKMTGVELPITTDATMLPPAAILVGPTRHTDFVMGGADSGAAARGTDGFRLKARPPHFVVHSSDSRGCLYGVYELLETYGGVGWFASWRTVVPSREEFAVPADLDVAQTPAFHMRLTSWLDATDGDFACHLRLNGARARLKDRHGGAVCRFGRNVGNCHTYNYLLPVKKYFNDHPEYFAMRNGRREIKEGAVRWGYTQPCLTNPDVLRIVTSNLLAAIAADPDAGLYGVSQNDNLLYCQCPACAAVDEEEGSHAGTTVRFVNAVAAEVEKRYPNAVIETLAYQYTRKPPKKTRLRHNVMPCLCSIECDFHKPMNKSSYAQNAAFVDDIRGWKAQTDMLYLWDYTTNFRHYMHAFPNIMALQGNLRFYRANGVKYMLEQGDSQGYHADFAELRAWLIAKWMWNPDAPVEPLLDRFFKGYYGAAAPHVRRYFDELYALPRDSATQPLRIYETVSSTNMPTAFFERAEALWKAAEAAVADDPPCRSNVVAGALSTAYTLVHRLPRPRRIWATRHPEAFASDARSREYARRLLAAYKPMRLRFAESADRNKTEIEKLKRIVDAKIGAPCDSAEVPARGLTFRLPGVRGEYVKDEDTLDGSAIRLYNTHYEWSVRLDMDDVAYDQDVEYQIRARVRVEKEPGATGEAFWAGVYDTVAKRGCGGIAPKVADCGEGYVWYDVCKWRPKDGQYFWIGPGRFRKSGGRSSVKGVWVDRVEIARQ